MITGSNLILGLYFSGVLLESYELLLLNFYELYDFTVFFYFYANYSLRELLEDLRLSFKSFFLTYKCYYTSLTYYLTLLLSTGEL